MKKEKNLLFEEPFSAKQALLGDQKVRLRMSDCGSAVKKQFLLKRVTDRDLGTGSPQSPETIGNFFTIFCNFRKKRVFECHLDHSLHVFRAISKNYIFKI